jgi:hypothetical protein
VLWIARVSPQSVALPTQVRVTAFPCKFSLITRLFRADLQEKNRTNRTRELAHGPPVGPLVSSGG